MEVNVEDDSLQMWVSAWHYQRLVIICNTDLSIVQRLNGAYLDTQVIVNTICSFLYCCYRNAYTHTQIFIDLKRRGSGKGSMKILPKREYVTCKKLVFNLNLNLKHSTFFFHLKNIFHVLLNGLCEKYDHIPQIKGLT